MKKLSLHELNRITVDEFKQSEKIPVTVILDNVRSMNNVGSVFRTSDAFLIEQIYLCGITATPPHKEIEKTALGATQTVLWKYSESTQKAVHDLLADNYKIYAVEQATQSVMLDEFETDFSEKIAVVFGNEVMGVEQEVINLCHGCIEIPQMGTKHSLNVSVSAGIVLWQLLCLYKKSFYKTNAGDNCLERK